MAITETVSEEAFVSKFTKIRPNNFTVDGLRALFNYLEELSDETGTDIELDIIAIACEYAEYFKIEDALDDYALEDEDELRQHTYIIEVPNSSRIIISQF